MRITGMWQVPQRPGNRGEVWPQIAQMDADFWMLNEKAAGTFIANARTKLAPEDVSLATFHLKRYVLAEMERKK